MHTHNVLYRGWTIVVLVTLLLLAVSLPGTAAPTAYPAAEPNAGWREVGTGSATGGGISDNSSSSWYPSVAIAPDGMPYVAWFDYSGGDDSEIYVRRWNGSSWEEVGTGSASGGGISDNSGHSGHPSVAVAPDGTPYVAWADLSGVDWWEIYVRRWNGSSWEEVGVGSATGRGISDTSNSSEWPAVAVAPDGTPYVAWSDYSSGDWEIYVRRWNGSSWEEVGTSSASGGGISNNSGESGPPSLAIAPDGRPYVTWEDNSGGDNEIYVRRWNESSWEEVGTGSATGGGISDNSGESWSPSVAIAPDGTPYVTWEDNSGGNPEIYVRCWNGSSWEEVGTGSASGGGISNNSNYSEHPSVAIAPNGTPYVAWYNDDDSGGDTEIYVRRWNGSSWEEVGIGSASGGGISDNSHWSRLPSVAIAPDGTPYVAWEDDSGGDYEIYVRRWEGYCSCGPDNYEPNDTFAQAYGPLTSGQTYPSYISCCDVASRKDYFYIDISTTNPIEVDLTNIPAGVDYDLYLYNSAQNEVSRSWEPGNAPEHISYDPPNAGRYYILVFSPYSHYSTSPYSLRVTYDGSCGPDNYEPNDSFAQAYGPLNSGQTYQSYISYCDVASQRDYFYIDISTTNPIEVDLTNIPAGVDYDLYLYNSAQDRVGQSQENGNAPEHISYTPTSAGRYYILVFSPYSHYSTSPYSLRVTYDIVSSGKVYLPIIMSSYCSCGSDNYEPNAPCDQAYGPLNFGQTYQSWLSCCDVAFGKDGSYNVGYGYDYFSIQVGTNSTPVTIVLSNIPSGCDYGLYLFRQGNCDTWIASSQHEGNVNETISISLNSGTYYILVYSGSDTYKRYSPSPYSLRVTYD